MKINKLNTQITLLLTIIFWSTTFICVKICLSNNPTGFSPGALALLRTFSSFITMLIFFIINKGCLIYNPYSLIKIGILGVLGFAIYNLSLNYGELSVNSSIAAFIIGQTPIAAAILAYFIHKEKYNLRQMVGIAIGFLGVLLLFVFSDFTNRNLSLSLVIVFITMISGALYTVLQKKLLLTIKPFEFVTYALFFGTITLIPFIPNLISEVKHVTTTKLLIAIYSGVFPGAIAYLLWSYILSVISINRAMSYFYAFPFISYCIGVFIFKENITLIQMCAAIIALTGSIIYNLREKKND